MRTIKKLFPFSPALILTFILSAYPASAAGPTIGTVSPTNATSGMQVDFTASVTSPAGIKSCNLYVDLEDVGEMTVSGNTASRSFTFTSGGSRIAFVFCKDNSGGMASGPNTAIWVQGSTVNSPPLTPSQTPSTPQDTATSTTGQVSEFARKLMKLACADGASADDPCKAVYYIGADGKRHAFPNSKVYFTWYADFDSVETVTPDKLSTFPLGKNVTYRPGVRMVKFQTLDKVYAVGKNGVLRWITSEDAAKALYGVDWNTRIDDLPDTVYTDYSFGADVSIASEFAPALESAQALTFD